MQSSATPTVWQAVEKELFSLRSRAIGLAYRIVGNPADAEDVVQEAYLHAFRGIENFEGKSRVETWFFRIVCNQALSHLRSKSHYNRIHSQWSPWDSGEIKKENGDFADPNADFFGELERRNRITLALGLINPLYSTALTVRYLNDLSEKETAEALGVSVKCAKIRTHRARLAMVQVL